MTNGNIGSLVALDQSAAYDLVDHKILIKKMKHIGMDNNSIKFLNEMKWSYCLYWSKH